MKPPDKAMVLGAGIGKRMRPLTDDLPKPLVRLNGKALIDYVLDRLSEADIGLAVVNIHYCADKLEDHLRGRKRPAVRISDEREVLLDTGGGVQKALPLLGDRPFFIHNADSVWIDSTRSNLEHMGRLWDEKKMDCLMLLANSATSMGYSGLGDFAMGPDGRLSRRNENEVVPFVYAGVCLVHPRLFDRAPEGAFSLNVLWDNALEEDRLFGVRHDGIWMHVGTPEALEQAEKYLNGKGA